MPSTPNAQSKLRSKLSKLLLAIIFVAIVVSVAYTVSQGGPWVVPDSAKQVKNPLLPSEDNLKAAHTLYMDKCAECHGDSGKGDGDQAHMYSPLPSNLTDATHLDSETDGELFYKVTYGHKLMPAFRKRLTDRQRWQLVLLIRFLSHPPAATARASGQ